MTTIRVAKMTGAIRGTAGETAVPDDIGRSAAIPRKVVWGFCVWDPAARTKGESLHLSRQGVGPTVISPPLSVSGRESCADDGIELASGVGLEWRPLPNGHASLWVVLLCERGRGSVFCLTCKTRGTRCGEAEIGRVYPISAGEEETARAGHQWREYCALGSMCLICPISHPAG